MTTDASRRICAWCRQRLADAYRTAGRALRQRAHNAPGRYRQEGVLLAASWLAPEPAEDDAAEQNQEARSA